MDYDEGESDQWFDVERGCTLGIGFCQSYTDAYLQATSLGVLEDALVDDLHDLDSII